MESVEARVGMPLAEFLEAFNQQPFELINGERINIMPGIAGHSYVIHILYQALLIHLLAHHMGEVLVETTFILPDTYNSNWVEGSRTPDLMYIAQERLNAYRAQTLEWKLRPYGIIPDLVVEVISPNDKVSELDAKIDAYLADGVRLVWVIDPQRRKVHIHEPDNEMVIQLSGEAVLDGGEVLPGFQMALPKLFE